MSEINMNEVVEEVVSDATVMTVPIDDTLSVSGEAADAKAVGDALALKADASSVIAITVNGEGPDNQGAILINGGEIPISDASGAGTIKAAVETIQGWDASNIPTDKTVASGPSIKDSIDTLNGKTAATIPMSSSAGAEMISAKIAAMDQTDVSLAQAVTSAASRTGADIAMSSDDPTKVSAAIDARLKSVNGILGDENGDVYLDEVPFADNLRSSLSQNVVGTFSQRASGGGTPIEDGAAWLTSLRGNRIHTGYVPESINMTLTLVQREQGEDTLTAELDEDAFKEEVTESGTTTLSYTTSWSANPATYGITLTGTPKNGDVITIVYVKENRGTITQSAPSAFVSTGWNLYDHSAGYARAIKYSDVYGFCIEGTYTAVKFATTVSGPQSTITPVDGYFSIPSNGYIFVEGGNATDTEVYMTWSDWTDTAEHPDFQAYTENEIDLSTIMSTYFPNGLLRVGDVRDEIDLNVGLAISNVERLSYSAENLAAAKATGRTYEYDTNYIYLERAAAVSSEITLDGAYTVSDHGIEYFLTTTVPVYAVVLYGNNLKNKLEVDVLTKSEDLVNNLTTNDSTKALSAAQGYALNSKIATYTTGTISRHSATGTGGTFQQFACYKIGNVVNAAARLYSVSLAADGNFFSLPSGFRPKTDTYGTAILLINNVFVPVPCKIESDGDVGISYSGSQTLTQINFMATYPIEV